MKGWLSYKHSHNTTLKPEGEKEHETQVIFSTLPQHYIKT